MNYWKGINMKVGQYGTMNNTGYVPDSIESTKEEYDTWVASEKDAKISEKTAKEAEKTAQELLDKKKADADKIKAREAFMKLTLEEQVLYLYDRQI